MDKQKVEQSLKEIFDRCGEDIVQNHSAFKSAVFDLLDEINYSDERMVFRHAMDSKIFWILLETPQMTENGIKKAAEQIQKESHMTKEDTEFVLQCVAGARGMNADIASMKEESNQESNQKSNQQPIQDLPESEHLESQMKLPEKMGSSVLDVECRMIARGKKSRGKMFLCQDGLVFVPYVKDKKQGRRIYRMDTSENSATEIFYQNIKEICFIKRWAMFVYLFLMALVLLYGGFIGLVGLVITVATVWQYFRIRRRIQIKLSMEMDKISFLFQSHADKKKILSILQNR